MADTTFRNANGGRGRGNGLQWKRIVSTLLVFLYVAAVAFYYTSRKTLISISTVPRYAFNNTQLPINHTDKSAQEQRNNRTSNFVLCTIQLGGLGNQMFQFASAYGLADSKNMSLRIHKASLVANTFKINKIFIYEDRHYCESFKYRGASLDCGYDPSLSNFTGDSNFKVGVYMQSWLYFNHSYKALRKQFTFKDEINSRARTLLNQKVLNKHNLTSSTNYVLVGVHIRRGDMVNHSYGYNVATSKYLQDTVNYFKSQKFSKLIFVVCSNDIRWSKRNMPKNITFEIMIGNAAAVDMAILSLCSHTIMTVGTFGWWSAFLAGGQATYFKWPAKEGSGLRKQFSKTYSDYLFPHWLGF